MVQHKIDEPEGRLAALGQTLYIVVIEIGQRAVQLVPDRGFLAATQACTAVSRIIYASGQFMRMGSRPSQLSAASRTWSKMRMRTGVASAISMTVPGCPSLRK